MLCVFPVPVPVPVLVPVVVVVLLWLFVVVVVVVYEFVDIVAVEYIGRSIFVRTGSTMTTLLFDSNSWKLYSCRYCMRPSNCASRRFREAILLRNNC